MTTKRIIPVIILLLTVTTLRAGMSFDPARGLVEVQVVIDGHARGTFGIDTGADFLYIDREFARSKGLNLIPSARRPVRGVEGSSDASAISISSLAVGEAVLHNIKATAIDMQALVSDKSAIVPQGVIGHQILKQFYVTVDYPNKQIELTTEKPGFLHGNRYEMVSFSQYKHLIIVDVEFNKTTTAPMILDYCASHTVLSPKLAGELSQKTEPGSAMRLKSVRIGDKVLSERVVAVVHDLRNFKKSAPRAKFEGILGATFLQQHKVTIDYTNQLVYFHKP